MNESISCCVLPQLVALACLGFGAFMLTALNGIVNNLLEPALKNVKGI